MRTDLTVLRLVRTPGCTLNHVAVYSVLCARARGNPKDPQFGWCWPSHKAIADDIDATVRTVIRCLKWLEQHGLVTVQRVRASGRQGVNRYWVLGGVPQGDTADTLTPDQGDSAAVQGDTAGDFQGDSMSVTGNSEGNTEIGEQGAGAPAREGGATVVGSIGTAVASRRTMPPAERARAAFAQLQQASADAAQREGERKAMIELTFAYWAAVTNQTTALFDDKRATRLNARLTENHNNIHEMLYAVDGCKRDRLLQGENERGRKYDGISTIFRDREQVERLARLGGYEPNKEHPQIAALLRRAQQQPPTTPNAESTA